MLHHIVTDCDMQHAIVLDFLICLYHMSKMPAQKALCEQLIKWYTFNKGVQKVAKVSHTLFFLLSRMYVIHKVWFSWSTLNETAKIFFKGCPILYIGPKYRFLLNFDFSNLSTMLITNAKLVQEYIFNVWYRQIKKSKNIACCHLWSQYDIM